MEERILRMEERVFSLRVGDEGERRTEMDEPLPGDEREVDAALGHAQRSPKRERRLRAHEQFGDRSPLETPWSF